MEKLVSNDHGFKSALIGKVLMRFRYKTIISFEVSGNKEYTATWLIKNNILNLDKIEFEDSFNYKSKVLSFLETKDKGIADW